jgi:CelD/BcsL family acetyltransferase involved in cellulose biosynthesis
MGILPFGVSSRRGITTASYLGGSHCNLNSPLFDPAFGRSLDRPAVESLLHDYCLAAGADVLVLANQPATWGGHAHVFACLGTQASTDVLARIETDANYESYADAQLSKDARSKLRRKAKKLDEAGARLLVAHTPDEVDLVLDAYLDQKAKRLAAIGADNPFAEPGVAAFLRQATLAGEGCLQLFGYVQGTEVLAVAGWLRRGEQASLMIMSFDADADQARNSPGEVLLTRIMAGTLGQGLSRLDFGLGTERYKTTWSNAGTPMFDTTFAVTAKGALYAQLRRLQTAVIRSIKQNHTLFDWLKRLRARVAGRRDDAKA